MGSKASTVPIYAAENVPASIRGGLVMCWQVSVPAIPLPMLCAELMHYSDVDGFRYFPRNLRQLGYGKSWRYLMAVC